jgi:hypothetical protein
MRQLRTHLTWVRAKQPSKSIGLTYFSIDTNDIETSHLVLTEENRDVRRIDNVVNRVDRDRCLLKLRTHQSMLDAKKIEREIVLRSFCIHP